MSNLSTINPDATYYVNDCLGEKFTFVGAQPIGGDAPPPTVPVMTAPH